MKDLGMKNGALVSKMPKMWYPSATVDAKDFPGLCECETGKDMTVKMKVRKIGEEVTERAGEKKRHTITVELRGMDDGRKPSSITEAAHMIRDEDKDED